MLCPAVILTHASAPAISEGLSKGSVDPEETALGALSHRYGASAK